MRSTRRDLAPYAATPERSRGRRYPEPEHPYRDCFERDRDRIVHSRAFRRLEYKTQVFPNYHGDHFRTRLTHTIEVAQLARTVARTLGLNATLSEAIALAHDIGHPPFGHVGEEALDELMRQEGGFEHNRHALRTLDQLEEKYAAFPGLNLTFEVREGLVKHDARYDRFAAEEKVEFSPSERAPIEAQIIDLVDHIAYDVHDIDDGIESRVLSVSTLAAEVPVFGRLHHRLRVELSAASERAIFNETIRRLIDRLVTDLIDTTQQRIEAVRPDSLRAVRVHNQELAAHSDKALEDLATLQSFLFENLYRSPLVHEQMERGKAILEKLFATYLSQPALLPPRHQARAEAIGLRTAIADYVAGMTDRFVVREHRRLVEGTGQANRSAAYDSET